MRKFRFEQLEQRLALTPVAACVEPAGYDVDYDETIGPADVLAIVQHLNRDDGYVARFDVNCDQMVSPLDVLQTINHINRFGVGTPAAYPVLNVVQAPATVPAGESVLVGVLGYRVQANRNTSTQLTLLVRVGECYDADVTPTVAGFPPTAISQSAGVLLYLFDVRLSRWDELEVRLDTRSISGVLSLTVIRTEWSTDLRRPIAFGLTWGTKAV